MQAVQMQQEGPDSARQVPQHSYIAELKKNSEGVRAEILKTLQAVNSDESAEAALNQAEQAMQAGDLDQQQLSDMVDQLPGEAVGHVLGSDKAAELLPEAEPLETAGVNEYDVQHLRHTTDMTDAQLNAMPELPEEGEQRKAA